eukprot:SAG25_NODE_14051_length_259_cov_1.300000_1_plen_56_part_01
MDAQRHLLLPAACSIAAARATPSCACVASRHIINMGHSDPKGHGQKYGEAGILGLL